MGIELTTLIKTCAEIDSQTLNQLSHSGAPEQTALLKMSSRKPFKAFKILEYLTAIEQ